MMLHGPDDPRHGTANGYKNHGCRCRPCKDAWNRYHKKYSVGSLRRRGVLSIEVRNAVREATRQPCGTLAGYVTHRRHHAPACDECKAAHAAYKRARRAQVKTR